MKLPPVPDLEGTTVLVTGASRGIGQAVAEAFVQSGANTHILAETAEVFETATAIKAIGHVADVTDPQAVALALEQTGSIDVLINNAGLERITPIEDAGPENLTLFRRILDINVTGMAIVTSQALPQLRPGARIINTASVWGRIAEPLFGAYVASKHAVIGLTKTWARELGPNNVRVNAVCPGWVETTAAMRSADALSMRSARRQDDVLNEIVGAQSLPGQLMQPEDVVGPYLFLASNLSANITGQTLGVDRGEAPW